MCDVYKKIKVDREEGGEKNKKMMMINNRHVDELMFLFL